MYKTNVLMKNVMLRMLLEVNKLFDIHVERDVETSVEKCIKEELKKIL
jgi:hypothetical protein